jgi:hypothetical protein
MSAVASRIFTSSLYVSLWCLGVALGLFLNVQVNELVIVPYRCVKIFEA